MSWVGRCPHCGEVFRGLKDGKTMGAHRAPWFALGGSRRERCPYSGASMRDAQLRITPLMRRTQAFIVREVRAGKPMTEAQKALLGKRNMLEETLRMIDEH